MSTNSAYLARRFRSTETVTKSYIPSTNVIERKHYESRGDRDLDCLLNCGVTSPTQAGIGWPSPNLETAFYTNTSLNPFAVPSLKGQCTWYVYGRIQEVSLITKQSLDERICSPQNRLCRDTLKFRAIFRSNANTWHLDAPHAGFPTGGQPREGSIAIWTSGGGGAGHVAFVESVNPDGIFNVTESNVPFGSLKFGRRSNLSASGVTFIYLSGGPALPQFRVDGQFSSTKQQQQISTLTGSGYTASLLLHKLGGVRELEYIF